MEQAKKNNTKNPPKTKKTKQNTKKQTNKQTKNCKLSNWPRKHKASNFLLQKSLKNMEYSYWICEFSSLMEAYHYWLFFFQRNIARMYNLIFFIAYKIYICLVFFVSIACTLLFLCPEEGTGCPENFTILIAVTWAIFCVLYIQLTGLISIY